MALGTVARLYRGPSGWAWQSLPPLPLAGYRWLGAAGVVGDWLVVSTGTNTSGFQWQDDDGTALDRGSVAAAILPNDFPVVLPSYRLNVSGWSSSGSWEPIAKFPGAGVAMLRPAFFLLTTPPAK